MEEAKKRACLIGFLTTIQRGVFVKLVTSKMFSEPFSLLSNIKRIKLFASLPNFEIDNPYPIATSKFKHDGLLLDPKEENYINGRFKKL